jgi:beta-glucosidase
MRISHSFFFCAKIKALILSILAFAIPILAAAGDGDWEAAYAKAKTALAKLSNANKVSLARGTGCEKSLCVGNIASITVIGFPELCLQDGPSE